MATVATLEDLRELPHDQQLAVLAHELAHLNRGHGSSLLEALVVEDIAINSEVEVRVRDHRPECVLDNCEGCAPSTAPSTVHPNVEATRALAAAETAVRAARDAYLRAPAQRSDSLVLLEATLLILTELPSPTALQDNDEDAQPTIPPTRQCSPRQGSQAPHPLPL